MDQSQVHRLARIIPYLGTFRICLLILCPDMLGKRKGGGAGSQRQLEGVKIIPVGYCKIVTESHFPQGPAS